MWAPALGRFLACRTVDRNFTSTLSLSRWGETGARLVVLPLVVPLVVYGIAYFVAWMAGMAHWSPGGGRWTTGTQIALNLVVNLTLLGVFGTATALGEELGLEATRFRSGCSRGSLPVARTSVGWAKEASCQPALTSLSD
jgi:hypothetical protein